MAEVTVERIESQSGSVRFEWTGTSGADEITGFSQQRNQIAGLDGDDVLRAGKQTSAEVLLGGAGADTLFGGLGSDFLLGGPGADLMLGGAGDDRYAVDDTGDVVVERARWADGPNGDSVSAEIDFSLGGISVENLTLFGSAAFGTGNALANRIQGNDSANTLDGGRGIDTLIGGDGDDTYILRHKDDIAVEPGLTAREKTLEAAQHGHDTVLAYNSYKLMLGIEDIVLQDVIGKSGNPVNGLTAIGNNLDNLVQGNATDNSLNGRTGNDTLTGGAGADDFIFSDTLGSQHADTVTDFAPGEDRVVIASRLVNLSSGALDADAFHLDTEAQTADHRLLFDGASLRYDADGSGAGAAVTVATFDGAPAITADDIFIA